MSILCNERKKIFLFIDKSIAMEVLESLKSKSLESRYLLELSI